MTEILTRTLYPNAAAQYDFTSGVGAATWVDIESGIWINKQGPVQLQWVYLLDELHAERAGRRIVVTGLSLSFGAASALDSDAGKSASYAMWAQNYGYTGLTPGHNRDIETNIDVAVKNVNQTFAEVTILKGDMSDFGGGAEMMAIISGIINRLTDADEYKELCVSCEMAAESEIDVARARYGVVTLHYYYEDAPTRAITDVIHPAHMAFGESAQPSGWLANDYKISLSNPTREILRNPVIRFVRQGLTPADDVDVMDPYTINGDIYAYGVAEITDRDRVLALYAWSAAPRATQIRARIDIDGRSPEYADFMIGLDKRYNPAITNFREVRAEYRSGEWVESDTSIYTMTDLRIAIGEGDGRAGFTLRAYYRQAAQEFDPSAYVPISIAGASINQYIAGVEKVPHLIDPISGSEIIGYSPNSDWIIELRLTDGYESHSVSAMLYKSAVNFHMSGYPNGGICAGGFCSEEGRSFDPEEDGPGLHESYYEIVPHAGIRGCDYSETETMTPYKWIDGKPIWRRVFAAEDPQLVGGIYAFTAIDDLDAPVTITGYIINQWGVFPLAHGGSTSGRLSLYIDADDKPSIYDDSGTIEIERIVIIAEYTKGGSE